MGTQYLIDTNAVIEFLGGILPEAGSSWLHNMIAQDQPYLSVINQIELLGYDGSTSEMQILTDFVDIATVLPLTEEVVQKTIELRKSYRIKLPDAIIASTALVYNLSLVTRNTSDFEKLPSLICVNPHHQ